MFMLAMICFGVGIAQSGTVQGLEQTARFTAAELMLHYTEDREATEPDTDDAISDNDSKIVTLEQAVNECNNSNNKSKEKRCVELIELIHQKIAIFVNGNRRSSGSYRDLPLLRVCFDGSSFNPFDPDTHVCCYGVLTLSNGYENCCNKTIIDSRKQFCCNDVIFDKTKSTACCGTDLYNTSSHICCKGTLQDNFRGATCCDNKVFDKREERCCFDRKVFNKTQGDSCCGDNVYNSTTHLCCETSIQPTYTGINRKIDQCCGDVSFHSECYRCDNGKLSPIYPDQLCCDGAFKERKYGNATECCLREIMDSLTEICQNGEIHKKYQNSGMLSAAYNDNYEDTQSEDIDGIIATNSSPAPRNNGLEKVIVIMIATGTGVFVSLTIAAVYVCWSRKRRYKRSMCTHGSSDINSESTLLPNLLSYRSSPLNDIEVPYSCHSLLTTPRFHETINIDKYDLIKETTRDEVNNTSDYFKCSSTQTYADKISNRRNILGKPFDYTEHLSLNKSTLQMPNSEVKMTLPHSILRDGSVEVNATTFRSVTDLQKKLDISSNEKIASPVVEYVITGHTVLNDYAVVVMPFIGNEEDLVVKKFKSDDGLKEVADMLVVPKQGKTNEELDMYYIVKGPFVYIYTKSFSGFTCTTCKHTRTLKLRAFIYGSYKRWIDPLRYEVCMTMYIADDILKFEDYKERMNATEAALGKILKKEKLLKLPKFLTEHDSICACVTPTDSHTQLWTPKRHPVTDKPIFEATQSVDLLEIVEKCKDCPGCHLTQLEVPYCMEWYMICKPGVHPSYNFQCLVDINTTSNAGKENETTISDNIVIDELQLRQEDRYPIEEGDFHTRCIRGVKEYLNTGILPRQRTELLKKLVPQPQFAGQSLEDVFFTLQEKYTSKGLLEAIASAMKSLHMLDDIDKLTSCGHLPRTLSPSSVQPVTIEQPPNIESLQYNRSSAPAEPQCDEPRDIGEQGAVGGVVQVRGEYHDHQQPRPELSHPNTDSHPINQSQSSEGSTITNANDKLGQLLSNNCVYSEMGQVRREIDSHNIMLDVSSEETIRDIPVQEHASFEQTIVKK